MRQVMPVILLGLLLTAGSAHGQIIRGTVVEDGTRAPIAGVTVELAGLDSGRSTVTETDSVGAFLLAPGRSGRFVVRLRHVAFRSLDGAAMNVGPAEEIRIELRMDRMVIPLEPLTVTTRRRTRMSDFHDRRQSGTGGRFLTREDIEQRPGARTSELLRMMPGVSLVPTGVGMDNLVTMRGGASGRCLATVYIDGMHFPQHAEAGIDAMLIPEVLEGVEVYSSGATAPALLHSRNSCGVVAFWTRGGTPGGRWSWRRFLAGVAAFGTLVLITR